MSDDNGKLGPSWAHLFVSDPRSPEERAEAERREYRRRKGTGRKDWWKKDLAPAANDDAKR